LYIQPWTLCLIRLKLPKYRFYFCYFVNVSSEIPLKPSTDLFCLLLQWGSNLPKMFLINIIRFIKLLIVYTTWNTVLNTHQAPETLVLSLLFCECYLRIFVITYFISFELTYFGALKSKHLFHGKFIMGASKIQLLTTK